LTIAVVDIEAERRVETDPVNGMVVYSSGLDFIQIAAELHPDEVIYANSIKEIEQELRDLNIGQGEVASLILLGHGVVVNDDLRTAYQSLEGTRRLGSWKPLRPYFADQAEVVL